MQLSGQVDDLTSGGNEQARYRTRREQLTWQNAWRPDPRQQWMVALERLQEKVDATPFPSAPASRQRRRASLGYTGTFGRLKVQADARHDRNSAYGSVDTGKLGVAFDLVPELTVRAVVGSAFRAPTFNDLYFPGYGVATVGPERSRSVEVGVQWRRRRVVGRGHGLPQSRPGADRVTSPIATLCPPDPAYAFGCARNVDRATLQGATLTAAHRSGPLALRASIDFLDARNDATGERLPRRAAHQEALGADWTRGAWTTALPCFASAPGPRAAASCRPMPSSICRRGCAWAGTGVSRPGS